MAKSKITASDIENVIAQMKKTMLTIQEAARGIQQLGDQLGDNEINKKVAELLPNCEYIISTPFEEYSREKIIQAFDIVEAKAKEIHELAQNKKSQLAELANIPKVTAQHISKIKSTTDIISQKAFDEKKNPALYEPAGAEIKIAQIKRKEIISIVSLRYEEIDEQAVKMSNDYMLNREFRSIFNAIISRFIAGDKYMTISMINDTMNGRNSGEPPTEKKYKQIENAIRIMRGTLIRIDATEEAKKLYPKLEPLLESLTKESYLLPAEYTKAIINGQIVDCIEILKKPLLLSYAEAKNQISTNELNLLAVPLNATEDTDKIKNYLLEQISIMKREKSHRNNIIRYDTLYTLLEVDNDRTKRKRIRDNVKIILEYWIKEKFITGYTELTENEQTAQKRKALAKIKIDL